MTVIIQILYIKLINFFNRLQPSSYYFNSQTNNNPQRVKIPANFMNGMPIVNKLCSLMHDEVVCALTVSDDEQRPLVYTGGKGTVKVSLIIYI